MAVLLGCVSDFSLGESLLSPEDIVVKAKELGYSAVSLTDNNLSSMTRFVKACAKHEIAAIVGVTLSIFDDAKDKTPQKKREKLNRFFRVKVFARTEQGLRSLYRLVTLANDNEHFYYVPRLSLIELIEALQGDGLCIASGADYSVFSHKEGSRYWSALERAVGPSYAFLELSAIDAPYYHRVNQEAIDYWRQHGGQFILTRPVLYAEDAQAGTLQILNAIVKNQNLSDPWRNIPYSQDLSFKTPQEFAAVVRQVNQSMVKIMDLPSNLWQTAFRGNVVLYTTLSWKWHRQEVSLPCLILDEMEELKRQLANGWQRLISESRFAFKPSDLQPYAERLKYEVAILKNMGFVRYFLMIADVANWAKENDIGVGPGRGSCAGSLVSYLLGITDVDPLRFHLSFERFINPERLDLPDIDLDFATSKRGLVLNYLVERYGKENVASVMNFSTLASASALRDTCRIYGLDVSEYECTKLVPKEGGESYELNKAADEVADLDRFRRKHSEIWQHAVRLQGRMRSYGTHAAGVCVGGEPIINRAPLMTRQEAMSTVALDKREIEDYGFVKIDCLGLTTLDVIGVALDFIEKNHDIRPNMNDLPLDDQATLQAFADGRTKGVFQFADSGITALLRDLANPSLTFDELVAATALYRPGPMQSGLMQQYVDSKRTGHVYYDHPKLESILITTYGCMVYQEQIMAVCRALAGFTGSEADNVRKSIAKKNHQEMEKWRSKFVEGCVAHSQMSEHQASQIFDKIEKFASYSFSVNHACPYTLISWQTMWLKVHYPLEFYAASLSMADSDKYQDLLDEAGALGIELRYPDINLSGRYFTPVVENEKRYLVAPFNAVKGISDKIADEILNARNKVGGRFSNLIDFLDNVNKTRVNRAVQINLGKVGAYDSLDHAELLPALEKSYSYLLEDKSVLSYQDRSEERLGLLPGLFQIERIDRVCNRDSQSKALIADDLCQRIQGCQACALHVRPHVLPRYGKTARFMVISDSPSYGEESKQKLVEGLGSEYLRTALEVSGLSVGDAYWTTLMKTRKQKDDRFTAEQVGQCARHLEREIEAIQPGLIIALGSTTIKQLIKGSKFRQEDAGKAIYEPKLKAAILLGINPQSVYRDPSKQAVLNQVFVKARELLNV